MSTSQSGQRRVAMTILCLVLSGLALLLWARLRLVTGAPRTAYADPNRAPQVASGHPPASQAAPPPAAR